MAVTPLVKKLGIKPKMRIIVLNAPEGYLDMLKPLPDDVVLWDKADDTFDFVQLFVKNSAELEQWRATAINLVTPGGLLWFAYPKKSGKIKTDLMRDVGWESLYQNGWDFVTLISIDETWSCFRVKPINEINYTPGSSRAKRTE